MLKMAMMVHHTEEMWLSRYQDTSVRDGTPNHLMNTIELPRGKFSCYFFRHRGNMSFVINYGFKMF